MKHSFQAYSARNFTPWSSVFETLNLLGYSQIEGFGALYENAVETRALLDDSNLSMPSGHFSLNALENDLNATLSTASTLGCTHLYCPHLAEDQRPVDLKGWQEIAARLSVINKKVTDQGFHFGWHNHGFEFSACADGTMPMRVLIESAPDIEWEMDVAWIARAGANPVPWITEFGSRITAVHIKDIAAEGECLDEDGWADVGYGTMNWKNLFDQIVRETNTSLFVAEHDKPSDFERFASRSIKTIAGFG